MTQGAVLRDGLSSSSQIARSEEVTHTWPVCITDRISTSTPQELAIQHPVTTNEYEYTNMDKWTDASIKYACVYCMYIYEIARQIGHVVIVCNYLYGVTGSDYGGSGLFNQKCYE